MRAVVVGGGVAGSAAAIALRTIGAEVVVLEAHPDPAGSVGSFVSLAHNGLRALGALGCLGDVQQAGFAVPRQLMWSGRGRLLADVARARTEDSPLHSVTLMRGELVATLRRAAARMGATVLTGRPVTDPTGDSALTGADLVVGADGVWSRVREGLDEQAPQPVFAGLASVSGSAAPGVEPDEEQQGTFNLVLGRRATFLYLPTPDGRLWWSAQLAGRSAPGAGAYDLPTLRGVFSTEPQVLRVLERAEPAVTLARHHTLGPLRRTFDDRTVLVGDAVHPVGAGQGASMAIEDAIVLARTLARSPDVATGIRTHVGRRRGRVDDLMKMARKGTDAKNAGPVAAWFRDLVMPLAFPRVYPRATGWLYRDEPVC